MDENRSVHDVLREVTGSGEDPSAVVEALRAAGHDLPGDLVVEAVASFTDTAPAAVAEHLSAFTTAYGPEGFVDPGDLDAAEMLPDGLALLASAPAASPAPDGEAGPVEALAFGAGAGPRDDDAVLPDDGPADDDADSAGPADVPSLPEDPGDPEDFVLGVLGTDAPDETFDPAELDAQDGPDTDIPL
ncbi:hypothetical protein [Myceligenerans xiligouense]|uniref:hypothetical protein n=1 Tax=Myceligenerans xiligouense TaxID=253184 RepID=UPI000F506BC5|nr:hypothetical protein [Myceligenerans xiligouense]